MNISIPLLMNARVKLIFLFLFLSTQSYTQTVRINEFMAINSSTIMDEDGDYSDWIEIYNSTSATINLSGYSLTDDIETTDKWLFPDITLAPNECLILFASGKNHAEAGEELHTNFKLSGDGEYLAFIKSDTIIVSEFNPAYPPQNGDVSFAFYNNDYVPTASPTPGAENEFTENELLESPTFSHAHGFYDSPFAVEISTPILSASIYYTTDGSEPSDENGALYSVRLNIITTTLLRAKIVLPEGMKSKITTATYLFLSDVIAQNNNPPGYPTEWGPYYEISGNSIADYEMDTEITRNPNYSNSMVESLQQIPTMSIVTDKGNLFSHSTNPDSGGIYIYTGPPENSGPGLGKGWERPVSVEYFSSDGLEDFQIDCGLKIHGGHSRRVEKTPKHSFRISFKSEYGALRLNYPLFGEGATDSFNTLVLRAGYGNSVLHSNHSERRRVQLIRDKFAKETQLEMGNLSGHGNYVHLYLNGIYWGIYNPTERIDTDFAETYLGGAEEDFDIIKDYTEVAAGNITAWDEMMQLANNGLSSDESYQRILGNNPDGTPNEAYKNYLDIENFINYMIINFYGTNWDWDNHNWVAIRNRVNPDKGFKFISWDAEHVIEEINGNKLNVNNDNRPTKLFQQLRENEIFRKLFANRVQKHFFNGGVLSPEANIERWMNNANQIDMAIISETARWGDYRRDVHPWRAGQTFDLYDKYYWRTELDFLTTQYFPQRGDVFIQQLKSAGLYPQTDAPLLLINNQPIESKIIQVGDMLSMSSSGGEIYYTTNGDDPIQYAEEVEPGNEIILLREDANKRAFIPTYDGRNNDWRNDVSFDDSEWLSCSGMPGGIGYETSSGYESYITLDVIEQMWNGSNPNATCYVRIPFDMSSTNFEEIKSLELEVLYDDGFAVYLNGTKIIENNTPTTLTWNSTASSGIESSGFESYNISEYLDKLVVGENLLAIHALNSSTNSSDFLINAKLKGSDKSSDVSISDSAILYAAPIELNQSSHIKARTLIGIEWSALINRIFVIPSDINNLKITEIHYNPTPMDTLESNTLEFIELKNIGASPIDLGGTEF